MAGWTDLAFIQLIFILSRSPARWGGRLLRKYLKFRPHKSTQTLTTQRLRLLQNHDGLRYRGQDGIYEPLYTIPPLLGESKREVSPIFNPGVGTTPHSHHAAHVPKKPTTKKPPDSTMSPLRVGEGHGVRLSPKKTKKQVPKEAVLRQPLFLKLWFILPCRLEFGHLPVGYGVQTVFLRSY